MESLAWDRFQRFCVDLIARLPGVRRCREHGVAGDPQQGIDIVAEMQDGTTRVYQCRRVRQFGPTVARRSMNKAKYTADAYFFVISRPATSAVRNAIRRRRRWDIYDVHDVANLVRGLTQETARRLVLAHFGAEWVSKFLGISPVGCYVPPEDYFAALQDSGRLFNHSWKLVGRRSHLVQAMRFSRSHGRAAILFGRGGIGKTRILFEVTKRLSRLRPDNRVYFVDPSVPLAAEIVGELPHEPCVLVVDDAHRRGDLGLLLALQRSRNHEIKLLFSCRPHGVEQLRSLLVREGYATTDFAVLPEVKELALGDVRELAAQVLGKKHRHLANLLATITRDCPLVTVVAGGLIKSGRLDPRAYQNAEEFRHEVLSRFGDEMLGKVGAVGDAATSRGCLELVSAVGPVKLNDRRFTGAMSTFLKMQPDEVVRVLEGMEKAGVVLRLGYTFRIVPDVLSDHLLHEVCISAHNTPTKYADRVFEAFRPVAMSQLLRNLGELDWLTLSGTGLLDSIWQSIQKEFEAASSFGRCGLFDDVGEAARYLPQRVVALVEYAMGHPSVVPETGPVAKLLAHQYTHSDVLERLPELLRSASYTIDYIPKCCDLLWELGRDDSRELNPTPHHAIRVLQDMAQYAPLKPVVVHMLMLDAALRWLSEPGAHAHRHSPLVVVDPVFVKETHSSHYEDGAFVYRPLVISKKATQDLRERARSIARRCLLSRQPSVTLRALHSLQEALRPPSGYFGRKIGPAETREWVSEDLKTLALVDELARTTSHPAVRMRIVDALQTYTRRSPKPVAEAAKRTISSIPVTYELKLTRVVAYSYGLDVWARRDVHKLVELHQEQMAALNADVASEFIKRNRAPAGGVRVLEQLVGELSSAGLSTNGTGVLLGSIAAADRKYASRMAGVIIGQKNNRLRPWFNAILHGVFDSDPACAADLASRAVATNDGTLCVAVAQWFSMVLRIRQPDHGDIRLLRGLLHHASVSVRRAGVDCLGSIGKTAPSIAATLATGVQIGRDADLAEELAGAFYDGVGVPLAALSDHQLGQILCKLEVVAKLGGHATEVFLTQVAERSPAALVRMMLNRLARAARRPSRSYDPVPDVDLTRCLNAVIGTKFEEPLLQRTLRQYSTGEYPVRRWLGEFFTGLSMNFSTPASLRVLHEYANSGTPTKLETVAALLQAAPHSFVRNQVDFVDCLLRAARQVGDDCYMRVASALHASAISGWRQSRVGEPAPQDVSMRDECFAIAKRLRVGSPSRQFYEGLAKHAQSSIDDQLARDAEMSGSR